MKVYIWSDLHLWHKNIIKYENRPFSSVEEMNDTIIKNWNEIVKPEDTIINLGDVSFRLHKEILGICIRQLPGKKILILGNHDRKKPIHWWEDVGFDEVYKYPIIYKKYFILSHEQVYINDSMPYVNIHGHSHSESSNNLQKVNVSIELTDYKPLLFDTIIEKFRKIEEVSE
jgi:calcineurin-like phosphoesterase family protein